MKRRFKVLVAGAAFAAAASVSFLMFRSDLVEHQRRLAGQSEILQTSFGQLEYAERGSGAPFLMIHGTGGGFDQGLRFAEGLTSSRVIAPSRFGYLRSDFPADPSSERQADAFVPLLDHLGLERVVVAGGSAGALSAAQFALRHPDRTSALILIVPAANVRGRDPVEMDRMTKAAVRRLTTSDLLFWLATKAARDRMIGTLLATDPALVERASLAERRRAGRILDEILPVSRRWRGMLNDAELAGNPDRMDFASVRVPTLVISVEDDRFGTAATARDIAAAVPCAKLVIYPQGGHIWVGHDRELWTEVEAFVRSPDCSNG
jgi:2-hydroxy-6-oxonona-2,4-dienedioate hydrolase